MDLQGLSVVAVKAMLEPMETVPEELLEAMSKDPRRQVQDIGKALRRKREREAEELEEQQRMLEFERGYHARGLVRVAGVDEVGRGPLAGPVVAAAVIFSPEAEYPRARDSKKLAPERREELFEQIHRSALAIGIGRVEHEEIDRINIYNASLLAMYRAVEDLEAKPDAVLVDGMMVLRLNEKIPQEALVEGDCRCLSIAAASIVAKVTRDRLMCEYDRTYPGYGFARHKGYPTSDHFKALKVLGPCPIHRRSFAAVAGCGDFSSREWARYYDALAGASCLEELERVAVDIRSVRGLLAPAELASLRALYRSKKKTLAASET